MRRLTVVAAGVVVAAMVMAVPAVAASGTFADDDGTVHEGMIEAIAADGVTKGCNPPDNTLYCPTDSVTRGQMAAFLVRALGLASSSTNHFADDDGTVFEKDINALATAGITAGCNPPLNTAYCPGDTVTRGQMAAFLKRAFAYGADSTDWFTDDDGSVFEADIQAIRKAGVTKGCNPPDNSRYCPDAPVERDQMASFLGRALELEPIEPTTGGGSVGGGGDGPATWGCVHDDGVRQKLYCSADLYQDGSGQGWSCEDQPGTRECRGSVNSGGEGATLWGCVVQSGPPVLDCEGHVDSNDDGTESWRCDRTADGVSCRGDLWDEADGDETWTCDVSSSGWSCTGQVDSINGGTQSWSCLLRADRVGYDCSGSSSPFLPFADVALARVAAMT